MTCDSEKMMCLLDGVVGVEEWQVKAASNGEGFNVFELCGVVATNRAVAQNLNEGGVNRVCLGIGTEFAYGRL